MEAQLVSEDQIQEALRIQRANGNRLGSILVERGAISEATLLEFLSQQYGVPHIDLSHCRIEPNVLNLVPIEIAHQYMIVPVRQFRSRLTMAMIDPSNIAVIDEMKFRTGLNVSPVIAMESDILETIQKWYTVRPGGVNSFVEESSTGFSPTKLPPSKQVSANPPPFAPIHFP